MKIVRPLVVSDLNLTTSNVTSPETGVPLYVPATVYALGDRVTQELAVGTVTITIASPAVITLAAHELNVGDLVNFTTTGALPTGITAGTQYIINSVTTNTFTIANAGPNQDASITIRTSGSQSGTHTVSVHIHKTYVSLQAANSGNTPRKASSSAFWQEEGASNRWKMFDGSVSSQTIGSTISIKITLAVTSAIDTIALLNIQGTSCIVKIYDVGNATYVYNTTHSLIVSGVTPQETHSDLILTSLPPTVTGDVWIEIALSDAVGVNMCAIGACLFGTAVDAGDTEYGTTIGIQDFSVIEQNEFGNSYVVERGFSRTASFQIMVPAASVPRIYRILTEQRAKKCLYIGSDSYTSTAIYGFPSDWSVVIKYPTHSVLNIDIKGLT